MSTDTLPVETPARPDPLTEPDQRLVLYGISWRQYSVMRELLDSPGLRMTYYKGTLELMTPSPHHERNKKTIARLIELWAVEKDVPLNGYGSTTFRREAKERGLEPDECWVLGGELREAPDIALEVVVTSGGIDKLVVYEGLGVQEVWFWEEGALSLYSLGDEGYVKTSQSRLVPELDLDEIAKLADRSDQHAAVQEFRDRLRQRS
jgi:Uma2 family endonuclease